MKVSYRDKIILVILVAAVTLAASFMLLVKPKMDDITSNKQAVKAALIKENDIKSQISKTKITSLKKTLDEQNAKNEELKQVFLQPKEDYNVDRFIQSILNADAASPISYAPLKLEGPSTTDLTKYIYTPVLISGTLQSSGNNTTANTGATPANKTPANKTPENKTPANKAPANDGTSAGSSSASLPAYKVEIGYKSSLDAIEKFLTRLTAEKGMSVVINEFTLGYEADATQPAGIDEKTGTPIYKKLEGNLVSGSIKLTVYFLEPQQFTAPKE